MNLMDAANRIRGMDDNMLMTEMQQPSGNIPQFMLMSEMKRRKDMRATQQRPVDTMPVMDEMMNDQAMNSGVAATPQMSQGAPASMNGVAALGAPGIPGFAGGGFLDSLSDWGGNTRRMIGSGLRSVDEFIGKTQQPIHELEESRKARVKRERAEAAAAKEAAFAKKNQEQQTLPITQAPPMPVAPQVQPTPNAVGPSGGRKADMVAALQADLATAEQAGDTLLANQLRKDIAAAVAAPERNFEQGINDLQADSSRGGPSGVKSFSRNASAPPPTPRNAPSGPASAVPLESGVASPGIPGAAARPELKSAEDYLASVNANNPDIVGPMLAANEKRLTEMSGRKKDNFNRALMAAGLGIMSGKSPHALTNIGEGGIMGLKQYTDGARDMDKDKAAAAQHADALRMAQQAAKAGNYKLAAELARGDNQNALTLHGHDVSDRRIAMQDAQNQRNIELGYHKADSAEAIAAARSDAAMRQAHMMEAGRDARNERSISVRETNARLQSDDKKLADDTRRQQAGMTLARAEADRLRRHFETAIKGSLSIDIQADPAKMAKAADDYVMNNLDPQLRAFLKPSGYTAPEPAAPTWTLTPNGQWAK